MAAFATQTNIGSVFVIIKGPAIAEAEAAEHIPEQLKVAGGIGYRSGGDGVIGPGAIVLDVVNIQTETAEADQVMDELPNHAGERILRGEMKDDDFTFALAFHGCTRKFILMQT